MLEQSLVELAESVRRGRVSAREIARAAIARIEKDTTNSHLDFDAVSHETGFGKQAAQRVAPGSVTAIQWRKGVELAELIGDLHGLGEKKRGMSESADFIIRKHATLWQTDEDSGLLTVLPSYGLLYFGRFPTPLVTP